MLKSFLWLAFIWIHIVYYAERSDLATFYRSSQGILHLIATNPPLGWDLLSNYWWHAPLFEELNPVVDGLVPYWYDARSLNSVRLLLPLDIISWGNLYISSLLVAALVFSASWQLSRVSGLLFPGSHWVGFMVWLFLPSLVFWTSAHGKDALQIVAMGMAAHGALQLLAKGKWRRAGWLWIVFGGFLLILVRPFLLAAWLAVALMSLFVWFYQKLRPLERTLALLLVGGIIVWGLTIWYYRPSNLLIEIAYQHDRMQGKAERQSSAQSQLLTLWNGKPTTAKLIAALPLGAFYGLYGPFPWAIESLAAKLAGLERLLLLLATLFIAVRGKVWQHPFSRLRKRPWVLGFAVFSIAYTAFAAVTVIYWGTLVRYTSLVWPVWALALFGFCLPSSAVGKSESAILAASQLSK